MDVLILLKLIPTPLDTPPQTLTSKIKEGNKRNRGSQGVKLLGILNSWRSYL